VGLGGVGLTEAADHVGRVGRVHVIDNPGRLDPGAADIVSADLVHGRTPQQFIEAGSTVVA
jgi:hypothetical protein